MRRAGLSALLVLGAMLTLPVLAQTPATSTPTAPTVKPPVAPIAPPVATTPPKPSTPAAVTPPATTRPTTTTTSAPATPPAPVDINSATATQLDAVKYIGKARAAKIIAGRPWASPDDLVTKKVIPQKYYDQIKDRLVAK